MKTVKFQEKMEDIFKNKEKYNLTDYEEQILFYFVYNNSEIFNLNYLKDNQKPR